MSFSLPGLSLPDPSDVWTTAQLELTVVAAKPVVTMREQLPSFYQEIPKPTPSAQGISNLHSERMTKVGNTENHPDNLAMIRGVGEAYKRRLYGVGIYTWRQVAESDIETLRRITRAKPNADINAWRTQARELAEKYQRWHTTFRGPLDDFTRIDGIGAITADIIYKAGITTYEQLAATSVTELAELVPSPTVGEENDFDGWINAAVRLNTLKTQKIITVDDVGFTFVYVPSGPFTMGSIEHEDEKPLHTVNLDSFSIMKTPITNAQYALFLNKGGYANEEFWTTSAWQWRTKEKIIEPRFWQDRKWRNADQPVVGVSWHEAIAYANWLAQTSGKTIRLPTEAEWEKAARGVDGRKYPWGNDLPSKDYCNYDGNVGRTNRVGHYSKGIGPYGTLDMAGNVWEWTRSQYKMYPYKTDDGREDLSDDRLRVLRGGSWNSDTDYLRTSSRYGGNPANRNNNLGLRLVAFL